MEFDREFAMAGDKLENARTEIDVGSSMSRDLSLKCPNRLLPRGILQAQMLQWEIGKRETGRGIAACNLVFRMEVFWFQCQSD